MPNAPTPDARARELTAMFARDGREAYRRHPIAAAHYFAGLRRRLAEMQSQEDEAAFWDAVRQVLFAQAEADCTRCEAQRLFGPYPDTPARFL